MGNCGRLGITLKFQTIATVPQVLSTETEELDSPLLGDIIGLLKSNFSAKTEKIAIRITLIVPLYFSPASLVSFSWAEDHSQHSLHSHVKGKMVGPTPSSSGNGVNYCRPFSDCRSLVNNRLPKLIY